MTNHNYSIEEAFKELDEILKAMEDPALSLTDSLSLYKKGVLLLDQCGQTLNQTEKELKILQEGMDAG